MPFFEHTRLEADSPTPIYQQLYDYVRTAILSGQLQMGTRLPSTRALADELSVSRNTVLSAYDQLFAEGYLESVGGKGTFVTHTLPESLLTAQKPTKGAAEKAKRVHTLSERASTLRVTPTMPSSPFARRPHQAFETGTPALDQFPYERWSKLVARHAQALHPQIMGYQHVAGYRPLREAIADHVLLARQVRCTPDQVIIVSGSQGGLYLAASVLLNAGDEAWVEDPGYLGARRALLAAGAKLVPIPVDRDGLDVDAGIARSPDARMVYLTPSHQFPLGVTMSLRRRLDLLAWAKGHNAYVLEDDYDSEYRFSGRPLASLQGLNESESVIYVGTFSKVLFPTLRLGYLIVPPGLVDAFLAFRSATDYHLPMLEQLALADFIAEGHFTRHIRRMRTLYGARREMLIEALKNAPLEIDAPETGMHFVGWLPAGVSDRDVAKNAEAYQVRVLPVSTFTLEHPVRDGLILGYASVDEAEIRRGAEGLVRALL
ncbi:MAG: PLP-dependent aminotransferase family protein [Anaerolineae bacterium]|nr:PLP-dependent aminotransferase family protein [Anaerolineae bacterium]